MSNKSGQTFELPKKSALVAELFTTQEQRDDAKRERVIEIPISEIDHFPDHPFQVRDDEDMQQLVDSVKAIGIHTPGIARQKEDGRYELVSGHRRKYAAVLAGLKTMPLIVRDLTREEAAIAMVDANLQREVILPSEKAFSYKIKLDAMKRQGNRSDLTCTQVVSKLKAGEKIADVTGESREQIRRYIRLTELIPDILAMVDNAVINDKSGLQMAFRPAVELSYLTIEEQSKLLEIMMRDEKTPSLAQAQKMKQFSQMGRLSEDVLFSIMAEEKPNQKEQVRIPREKLIKYFPSGTSSQKMEETIIKALDLWRQRERNRDSR